MFTNYLITAGGFDVLLLFSYESKQFNSQQKKIHYFIGNIVIFYCLKTLYPKLIKNSDIVLMNTVNEQSILFFNVHHYLGVGWGRRE